MNAAAAPTATVVSGDVFHAVADATRRRILELLSGTELRVSDIANLFDISQPGISQHLAVLRTAGLVNVRRAGRQRLYSLNPDPLGEVADWINYFERYWTEKLKALENPAPTTSNEGWILRGLLKTVVLCWITGS